MAEIIDESSFLTPEEKKLTNQFIAAVSADGLGGVDVANAAVRAVIRSVSRFTDENSRTHGADVYERMMRDADVSNAVDQLRLSVAGDGWRLLPAVATPSFGEAPPGAERAKELADAVQSWLDGFNGDVVDVTNELARGIYHGNAVAEIVGRSEGNQIVLDRIQHVETGLFGYLINTHSGIVGLRRFIGTSVTLAQSETELKPDDVPRWKLMHFAYQAGQDPRGRSILAAAYVPWFLKTQVLPEFFRYLKQFASPSIKAELPVDSDLVQKFDSTGSPVFKTDENGHLVPDVESYAKQLLDRLLAWVNATAIVVKAGTKVDYLKSDGDGSAYQFGLDYFGRQITEAILGTAQATKEAKHESRSSKSVAQDVVGLRIANLRRGIARVWNYDVIKLFVELNFGRDALALAPKLVFGSAESQDIPALIDSYSKAFAAGFLRESQLAALHAELGLPSADWEQERQEEALRQEQAMIGRRELDRVLNPDA